MFKAALLIIANICNGGNPRVHQQKIWYINTMEYYLAIKKNEVLQQFGYT